jgi:hypothetical protein
LDELGEMGDELNEDFLPQRKENKRYAEFL